jgi:hypothetical protein
VNGEVFGLTVAHAFELEDESQAASKDGKFVASS